MVFHRYEIEPIHSTMFKSSLSIGLDIVLSFQPWNILRRTLSNSGSPRFYNGYCKPSSSPTNKHSWPLLPMLHVPDECYCVCYDGGKIRSQTLHRGCMLKRFALMYRMKAIEEGACRLVGLGTRARDRVLDLKVQARPRQLFFRGDLGVPKSFCLFLYHCTKVCLGHFSCGCNERDIAIFIVILAPSCNTLSLSHSDDSMRIILHVVIQ